MRAVNLIPADQQRASSAGSRGAYGVLAVLAALVVMVAVYTLAGRDAADKQAESARVEAEAAVVEQRAARLASYTSFVDLRARRTQTVTTLAASRFDWSHALHEVARTMPKRVWLTSLRATVTPSTAVQGGAADPLRGALAQPAIELVGCTTSQSAVARLVTTMRRIDGVTRVSLSSSEKAEAAAGSSGAGATPTGAGAAGGDCRAGSSTRPKFSMVIFFQAPAAPTAAAPSATASTTSTTATTSTATPATTTATSTTSGSTTP